jgi:cell division protein FtsB
VTSHEQGPQPGQQPFPPQGYHSPQPPKRHTARNVLLVLGLLFVVAAIVGAVVYADHRADLQAKEEAQRADAAAAEREAERRAEAERQRKAAVREAAQKVYTECVAEMTPLMDELGAIDAKLDVGQSVGEFGDAVADASVVYSRIDADELSAECVPVGVELESALNKYISVASTWDDCVYDYDCSTDSIQPQMQRKWAAASRQIEKAETALDNLEPGGGTA